MVTILHSPTYKSFQLYCQENNQVCQSCGKHCCHCASFKSKEIQRSKGISFLMVVLCIKYPVIILSTGCMFVQRVIKLTSLLKSLSSYMFMEGEGEDNITLPREMEIPPFKVFIKL